jgi:hypothetical protein
MSEEPSPESRHAIKVYDLDQMGIDILGSEDTDISYCNQIADKLGIDTLDVISIPFKVPQAVGGFMRMVSSDEIKSRLHPSDSSIAAKEYLLIDRRKLEDTTKDFVPGLIRQELSGTTRREYTHAIFIPREEFDQFDPIIYIHPNYDSTNSPAVTIRAQKDELRGKDIHVQDWTEKVQSTENK